MVNQVKDTTASAVICSTATVFPHPHLGLVPPLLPPSPLFESMRCMVPPEYVVGGYVHISSQANRSRVLSLLLLERARPTRAASQPLAKGLDCLIERPGIKSNAGALTCETRRLLLDSAAIRRPGLESQRDASTTANVKWAERERTRPACFVCVCMVIGRWRKFGGNRWTGPDYEARPRRF